MLRMLLPRPSAEFQPFARSFRPLMATIGVSTIALLALAHPAHGQQVVNGSFEVTTCTPAQVNSCTLSNSNLPPWTVVDPAALSCLVFPTVSTNSTICNGFLFLWSRPGPSPDGGNYIAVDGDTTCCPNNLTQTLTDLVPGQGYQVSFFQAAAQFYNLNGATTEWWHVTLDSGLLGSESDDSTIMHNAEHSFVDWMSQTLTFVARSATAALSFMARGTPAGAPPVVLLDGVRLSLIEGFMTGGGSVFTSDGTRVTHGFELHCDITKGPNNLEVNFGGNSFHLETLTAVACSDDPAISPGHPPARFDTYRGEGIGRFNGVPGATIRWTFTDAGEPGTNDFAQIEIKVGATTVLSVSGNLKKGNHQAHNE